jgi:hypothetical protein
MLDELATELRISPRNIDELPTRSRLSGIIDAGYRLNES